MITTFLWMLYLAFTLYITIKAFGWLISLIIEQDSVNAEGMEGPTHIGIILTSLLWSIWYFYYLN